MQNSATLEGVKVKYSISNLGPNSWQQLAGAPAGLKVRDLGIKDATDGKVTYRVLQTDKVVTDDRGWRYQVGDVRVLLFLSGWAEFEFKPGELTKIEPGTCVCIPGGMPFNERRYSADLKVLELITDDGGIKFCPAPKPTDPPRQTSDARFSISPLTSESWTNRGRRAFLEWRDMGVEEATGGRLSVHGIRARQGKSGLTGWHYHTTGLHVVYGIHGGTEMVFEPGTITVLGDDTCICIPPGQLHDELSFPDNLELIEVTMGKIGTVNCDPPKAKAAH